MRTIFRLETLSSHTQYLAQKPHEGGKLIEAIQVEDEAKPDIDVGMRETLVKRTYTRYSDQSKLMFFKLFKSAVIAKRPGIHIRTAQRWVKQYEEHSDSGKRNVVDIF